MRDTSEKATEWLINGEVGISSRTMVARFEGYRISDGHHPCDPDDFRRCCMMLNRIPEYRARMDELRGLSPVWDRLVENWAEFEAILGRDLATGVSTDLFERMKDIGC